MLSAVTFNNSAGRLHRGHSATDDFRGVVYLADVRDKEIERHNLQALASSGVPCWPDPSTLLALSDRHAALARCVEAGLVEHPVVQGVFSPEPRLPFPYVLKVGNEHRGEGKHLIRQASDIPRWEGIASMEPFFQGESARVLVIGERTFGVKIRNEQSWIKNSEGASFEPWSPTDAVAEHARRVARAVGLLIAGVDYVLDAQGFHFIEVNPFPRLGISQESTALARVLLGAVLEAIEKTAEG